MIAEKAVSSSHLRTVIFGKNYVLDSRQISVSAEGQQPKTDMDDNSKST